MTDKLSLSEFIERSSDDSNILPPLPNKEELKSIRKDLRKKEVPNIELLPLNFEYEGIGKFSKQSIDSDVSLVWKTANGTPNNHLLSELCMSAEHEIKRLEFGWMIANFARLDGRNHLNTMRPISYSDFHQNLFWKQYSERQKHFQNIENIWRHWAIVPAGHMVFKLKS